MTMPEVLVNGKRWMPADDYERLKEDLREAYKRIHDVKALAVENEILRAENHALEVEVDRLKAQNLINIDSLRSVIARYA